MVSWMTGCCVSSLKTTNLMMGCCRRDIRYSVMSEMGQGELIGFIHCTWIPFILVAISQSHLSPLSRPYSANPPIDPKTHISTGTIGLRAAKGGSEIGLGSIN